jgi:hypothetical protein
MAARKRKKSRVLTQEQRLRAAIARDDAAEAARLARKAERESEAAKERVREQNRASKRRERARKGADGLAEQRRAETLRCYDLDLIRSQVTIDPSTGCWNWTGSFVNLKGRLRPLVRAGAEGKAFADAAAWRAAKKRSIPPGCWVVLECRNVRCVNPSHIVLSSPALARAKRRLAHDQQDIRPGQGQGQAG